MDKRLQASRKKFRGQKGKISTGYQQKKYPEGKYTCKVTESKVEEINMNDGMLAHTIRLQIALGDQKGGYISTFPQDMEDVEGIQGSAKNVMAILGDDVVPGEELPDGDFQVDFGDYLACVEDLVAQCIGEFVEVTIKNGKKKPDGTFYQNVYINRGLGSDAKAISASEGEETGASEIDPDDNLNMTLAKKRKAKAKKKVTPKKKKKAKKKVKKRK